MIVRPQQLLPDNPTLPRDLAWFDAQLAASAKQAEPDTLPPRQASGRGGAGTAPIRVNTEH